MNNEFNNNKPSNDPLLTETSEAVTNDTIQNEQSTIENEDAKVTEEKVDKKEKDLSLPTTMEDYIKLSKNFYAGFWVRFVAYLIDMIVIYAVASLLNTFSFGLLNKQLDFPILGEESLSYVIVMFTYFIAMTYFFTQTLGKMIMKIKVETNKGDKLSFSDVVYRELIGRLLTIFLAYIPYIAVAFTNKRKGLHDFIADTVVVKEDFSKLRRQMNEKLESKN
ncbi:RDD family protein [uncultured Gemella sp.]|uniref:RDD family protein n=1 Tax=uncultured Gemella sp. TaxID=254352 RepID=UPI0028E2F227|nr:RDD family protein [uncultured Gemella sp.]